MSSKLIFFFLNIDLTWFFCYFTSCNPVCFPIRPYLPHPCSVSLKDNPQINKNKSPHFLTPLHFSVMGSCSVSHFCVPTLLSYLNQLTSGTPSLDPHRNSSWVYILLYPLESWRSCGYLLQGQSPSHTPASHRWGRCKGGLTQCPGCWFRW